jgi:outer membrane lipoprotein-sorting protein
VEIIMLNRHRNSLHTALLRVTAAASLIAGVAAASPASGADAAAPTEGTLLTSAEILDLLDTMEKAYAKVSDYTATFTKQERVKGRLHAKETMSVKFARPFSLYLKWIAGKHEGQEVIFVRGWNDGKIRAHTGSFPDITVDLAPENSLAMRGNRHPITDFGIGNTIDLLARDARLAAVRPQDKVTYVDLGISTVAGVRARCVVGTTPGGRWSVYYAPKARLCVDVKRDLPIRVTVWDAEGELLEDYTFRDLKLNVGLSDGDFSPSNGAYGF